MPGHHHPGQHLALPYGFQGQQAAPGRERAGLGRRHDLHVQDTACRRLAAAARFLQPLPEAPEGQGVEHRADPGRVPGQEPQVFRRRLDRDILQQVGQLPVQVHLLARRLQALPQPGRVILQVGVDAFEAAVLRHQAGRRLLPHPGHPGQVVRGVAPQGGVVGVLRRGHPVAVLHPAGVGQHRVADPPPGVDHLDRAAHQLEGVAVAGHHQHLPPGGGGAAGHRGDDIVGLVAGQAELADSQAVGHFVHQRQLLAEQVRRSLAGRLVAGVGRIPEGGLGGVPGHRHGLGMLVAQQLDHHRGEPEHGVGGPPVRGREVGGQGVERPVGEAVPVEQGQAGHGLLLCRALGAAALAGALGC